MTMTRSRAKPGLTIAGSDLSWLMELLQATQDTFTVTVVQTAHAISTQLIAREDESTAAVVELHPTSSAIDVRDLLDRSPNVRFVFIADVLPLRHAVARIIRERGHAVLARSEPSFVIAATVAALMAGREGAP
jgi:hypothetical protein